MKASLPVALFLYVCAILPSANAQNVLTPGLRADIKDTAAASIYRYVEVMPAFGGGADSWRTFLTQNLHPKVITDMVKKHRALRKTSFRERVMVEFVVCEDGGICNLRVTNPEDVHPELADEALRVMKLSPAWEPGKFKGQPVKVYFRQPITFAYE